MVHLKSTPRPEKRGSVLILVVALLVLMAMIATALIGNVRSDRATAVQNTNNTQVDLLLEGVKNMTISKVVDDLYNKGAGTNEVSYRGETATGTYGPFDGPEVGVSETTGAFAAANDKWLASRYPDTRNGTAAGTPFSGANPISWGAVSNPIVGTVFESPFPVGGSSQYTMRAHVQPTVMTTPFGQVVPALTRVESLAGTAWGTVGVYPAADADGDGIADSGLTRLPVGEINGLTYYVGVRIIDDAGAINLNTALSSEEDFDYTGAVATAPANNPIGLFRSNVGLAEFLRTYQNGVTAPQIAQATYNAANSIGTEMDALDVFRLTGAVPSVYPSAPTPAQLPAGLDGDTRQVIGDRNAAASAQYTRPDFVYVTLGDALENILARRVDSPGWGYDLTHRLRGFSVADQLTLAYRFTGYNPDASTSSLEDMLTKAAAASTPVATSSLYNVAGSDAKQKFYPTTDAGVASWFEDHFGLYRVDEGLTAPVPTNYRSRRTQLTLLSRTSNFASPRTASGSTSDVPVIGMRAYGPYALGNATATHVTGLQAVATRTSINTASWDELWRAFFSVMAEPSGGSPFGPDPYLTPWTPPTPNYDPSLSPQPAVHDYRFLYTGSTFPLPALSDKAGLATNQDAPQFVPDRFPVAAVTPAATPPIPRPTNAQHVQRSFRSPIRDSRLDTANPSANTPANAVNAGTLALRYAPTQVISLRSAIAAHNAEQMRRADANTLADPADTITNAAGVTNVRSIPIVAQNLGGVSGGTLDTHADIYPIARQPFITEIYASGDTSTKAAGNNPDGYLAIELFNPYDTPIVLDQTYKVVAVDRKPGTAFSPGSAGLAGRRKVTVLGDFTAGVSIPEHGYLIVDTVGVGTTYRPASSNLAPATGTPTGTTDGAGTTRTIDPAKTTYISMPTLISGGIKAWDNEIQVVKIPATFTAAIAPQTDIGDPATYANLSIMPLDSFDLTGFNTTIVSSGSSPISATIPQVWHYARASAESINGSTSQFFGRWTCVYPGRYDGSLTARRQQGTQAFYYDRSTADDDAVAWPTGAGPSLGVESVRSSYNITHVIQWLNADTPGPNSLSATGPKKFPFGMFARNGDILQVPFIGPYCIRETKPGGNNEGILELNPVTMDAAFAEDTDPGDDPGDNINPPSGSDEKQYWRESVGRFVPIIDPLGSPSGQNVCDSNPQITALPGYTMYRDDIASYPGVTEWMWRYHWATDLFEYLTVQNPNDDYLPNVSPAAYAGAAGTVVAPEPAQNSYGPPATEYTYNTTIRPETSRGIEDQVPIDGLINLNTASWRVLAALPWAQPGSINGSLNNGWTWPAPWGGMTDNEVIAKAIVQFRDGVRVLPPDPTIDQFFPVGDSPDPTVNVNGPPAGPFRSIYDIYRIPGLRLMAINGPGTGNVGKNDGDLSQADATSAPPHDDARFDFEERTLMLNRVSNLVTVRSDAFTAYIVLEGWKNAGKNNAERVVQRRAAFLIDRSNVTPTNPKVKTINIPTE